MNHKKIDWYYLCLEMMLEYISRTLDTRDTFHKIEEISSHFINVSKTLDKKTKNKNILASKDTENIANVKKLMARITRQNYELVKHQYEENQTAATSALRNYEKMLRVENLNGSQRMCLENGINELRLMLKK